MIDYTSTSTLKKGTIGERYIKPWIEEQGFAVFTTDSKLPHDYDLLATNKQFKFIGEVKTKCAREFYPDTGFDLVDFKHYQTVSQEEGKYCFIFFADECNCNVYGQWLHLLEEPTMIEHNGKTLMYPKIETYPNGTEIIYFPLSSLKPITEIEEETCFELQQLTKSNYHGKTH
ncbi:hypothetical protein V1387_12785 [Allomuricauda taeanensis]|uniref:hypothetical protein n=1 Tax=Flagellimonas taeanensis TaxID=1005926 RepID=UPI002E7B7782|nr:hypothetical protein [Allomuricauda taeanensis]MEE1963566.1 hypothetical protein [Allomuricauda taeanensis]